MTSDDKMKQIMFTAAMLMDEPHPDGGLGLQVYGLKDGATAFRVRVEGQDEPAFFVVGPYGTERLIRVLAAWKGMALGPEAAAPEPAPTDE